MGSRGRGRGRFGGGGFRFAKQEPFELFPHIDLPAIDKDKVKKNIELVKIRNKLQRELKNLPYFMEETFAHEEEETVDIERYSDRKKRGRTDQISLENSGYMTLLPGYFPLELLKGTKRRTGRKVVWNPNPNPNADPDQGLWKLDRLEKLEGKFKDEDGKRRNEEEEEEEEEEDILEELVDDSEDDYNQGIACDSDDDDYNRPEDDDDEPLL